jgi:hypothetical protein
LLVQQLAYLLVLLPVHLLVLSPVLLQVQLRAASLELEQQDLCHLSLGERFPAKHFLSSSPAPFLPPRSARPILPSRSP